MMCIPCYQAIRGAKRFSAYCIFLCQLAHVHGKLHVLTHAGQDGQGTGSEYPSPSDSASNKPQGNIELVRT